MKRRISLLVPLLSLLWTGAAIGQGEFPIADMIADRLVAKYQNSTCEQLWLEKAEKQGKPKSPQEQEMIQIMRSNPAVRAEFINRVAAPIVNKMFECGMVP
jgi:hypothetical protein